MSTLKELIEKHGMGNGQRYRLEDWPEYEYVEFYAMSKNKQEVVRDGRDGSFTIDMTTEDGWELYEEPKKQVTRWKWAFKDPKSEVWREFPDFLSEQGAKQFCSFFGIGTKYKKLTYTETSFEE